jgi:hypothetical protein
MQLGAYTFVETRRDPLTGEPVDVDKSLADVIEQIELADRVGLDVFGPSRTSPARLLGLRASGCAGRGPSVFGSRAPSPCCRRTIRR